MMKPISVWKQELAGGTHTARLASLYCCSPEQTAAHAARYAAVLDGLEATFGAHTEAGLYSAPGRTEIGGNHTDHQHGRVLAGSVNIDMIAAAAPNDKNQLRVQSEGYDLCVIDLNDLEARKEEENTTAALLRGECAAFTQRGAKLAGLDVYISSNVPKGSGVSSSAAFEVLIGVILNDCFMTEKVSPIAIAQIGQWAENVYFGKPSGLLDQTASSVGGFTAIDFKDPENILIEKVNFDVTAHGYALCVVDTGGNHANLTGEYAAIPAEMKQVAAYFGKEFLRDVDEQEFYGKIGEVRKQTGDRAVLRAMHFFDDDRLAAQEAQALRAGDFDSFKEMVIASGRSSFQRLQNVFATINPQEQGLSLALALTEKLLAGEGAWRVHGGGFAGTIQAYVPLARLDEYRAAMEKVFGKGACYVLSVRQAGGTKVEL